MQIDGKNNCFFQVLQLHDSYTQWNSILEYAIYLRCKLLYIQAQLHF